MNILVTRFYPKSVVPFSFVSKLIDRIKEKDTEKYNEVLPTIAKELIYENISDEFSVYYKDFYSNFGGELPKYPSYTTLLSTLKDIDQQETYYSIVKNANLVILGKLVENSEDFVHVAQFASYIVTNTIKRIGSDWFRFTNNKWISVGKKEGNEHVMYLLRVDLYAYIRKIARVLSREIDGGRITEYVNIEGMINTGNKACKPSYIKNIYAQLTCDSIEIDEIDALID